jgi:hypothetical protein
VPKERIFRGLHLLDSECIAPCPLSAMRLAPPLLLAYRRLGELLLLSRSAGSLAADCTSALLETISRVFYLSAKPLAQAADLGMLIRQRELC